MRNPLTTSNSNRDHDLTETVVITGVDDGHAGNLRGRRVGQVHLHDLCPMITYRNAGRSIILRRSSS